MKKILTIILVLSGITLASCGDDPEDIQPNKYDKATPTISVDNQPIQQ